MRPLKLDLRQKYIIFLQELIYIFIFAQNFFRIASNQIFKNYVILINHGPYFQGKDSSQF